MEEKITATAIGDNSLLVSQLLEMTAVAAVMVAVVVLKVMGRRRTRRKQRRIEQSNIMHKRNR
jgi:hypothetical protein